jgi:DNA polymerase (family 10)
MDNNKIAAIFREIADILEINGENPFRIRSYVNAAQIVESFPQDLKELAQKGEENLTQIRGIGKDLAAKIIEITQKGTCEFHQKLLLNFPLDLLQMLQIRGLGPKRVRKLREKLGIETLDALKKAAESGAIDAVEGFGEKMVKEIIKGLSNLSSAGKRILINDASEIVEKIIEFMRDCSSLKKIECAGSFRRRKESIGDLDFLVCGDDQGAIIEYFFKFPDIAETLARGETKSSVVLKNSLQVDLRIVDESQFGAALHYFTGSKAHNIHIRSRAQKMGLKVSEYGVFRGDEKIAGAREEDLFNSLNLAYIEPEMREDTGEIDLAEERFACGKAMPNLIKQSDLKGDLHMHTTWSDGAHTVQEMAQAYKDAGFDYIALTDHSQSLKVAHGLSESDLLKKITEIKSVQKDFPDFKIFAGAEVDILSDGSLDYSDEILAQLDIVVASIHSNFNLSASEQTARLIKAMENPHTKIIGHLHGRMINKRDGYEVDIEAITDAAYEKGVALEINSQPLRLDMFDHNCRLAAKKGVKMVINSDAHDHRHKAFLRFGIDVARRAWLKKSDILNCLPADKLIEWFSKNRRI